jgi:hypothetical protein
LPNSSAGQLSANEQPAARSGTDFLPRTEYLASLAHEVNAAHHNDVGFRFGGLLGQGKTVANKVSDVLYVTNSIVVGQNDGVFFGFQSFDFTNQCRLIHVINNFQYYL